MATAFPAPPNAVGTRSALLLAELQEAHDVLLRAIAALEAACGAQPTRDSIIAARWSISRASLARRMLWSRIYSHLLSNTLQGVASDLQRLWESDRALLLCSSQHVAKWGIDSVMAHWTAYCEASASIRWKMKAGIGAEKRVLYPILASGSM